MFVWQVQSPIHLLLTSAMTAAADMMWHVYYLMVVPTSTMTAASERLQRKAKQLMLVYKRIEWWQSVMNKTEIGDFVVGGEHGGDKRDERGMS